MLISKKDSVAEIICEVVGDKTVIRTLSYPVSHRLILEMVRYSIKLKVTNLRQIIMMKREKNYNLSRSMNRVKPMRKLWT